MRDLRKAYGNHDAVRGISFDVAAGEVFGLLGPNGAGKTTTIEILEGYRRRTAGQVRVLGVDPGRPTRRCGTRARGSGGVAPHARGHVPRLTAEGTGDG